MHTCLLYNAIYRIAVATVDRKQPAASGGNVESKRQREREREREIFFFFNKLFVCGVLWCCLARNDEQLGGTELDSGGRKGEEGGHGSRQSNNERATKHSNRLLQQVVTRAINKFTVSDKQRPS